jgi:hypothetical protein
MAHPNTTDAFNDDLGAGLSDAFLERAIQTVAALSHATGAEPHMDFCDSSGAGGGLFGVITGVRAGLLLG